VKHSIDELQVCPFLRRPVKHQDALLRAVLEVVDEPGAFLVCLAFQQRCHAMLAQLSGKHPGEQACRSREGAGDGMLAPADSLPGPIGGGGQPVSLGREGADLREVPGKLPACGHLRQVFHHRYLFRREVMARLAPECLHEILQGGDWSEDAAENNLQDGPGTLVPGEFQIEAQVIKGPEQVFAALIGVRDQPRILCRSNTRLRG
jgi:hypothetical protein